MSNVHPLHPSVQARPAVHDTPPATSGYAWAEWAEGAYHITRDGIVVGIVSAMPEIPFQPELVERCVEAFVLHERALRGSQ